MRTHDNLCYMDPNFWQVPALLNRPQMWILHLKYRSGFFCVWRHRHCILDKYKTLTLTLSQCCLVQYRGSQALIGSRDWPIVVTPSGWLKSNPPWALSCPSQLILYSRASNIAHLLTNVPLIEWSSTWKGFSLHTFYIQRKILWINRIFLIYYIFRNTGYSCILYEKWKYEHETKLANAFFVFWFDYYNLMD